MIVPNSRIIYVHLVGNSCNEVGEPMGTRLAQGEMKLISKVLHVRHFQYMGGVESTRILLFVS